MKEKTVRHVLHIEIDEDIESRMVTRCKAIVGYNGSTTWTEETVIEVPSSILIDGIVDMARKRVHAQSAGAHRCVVPPAFPKCTCPDTQLVGGPHADSCVYAQWRKANP